MGGDPAEVFFLLDSLIPGLAKGFAASSDGACKHAQQSVPTGGIAVRTSSRCARGNQYNMARIAATGGQCVASLLIWGHGGATCPNSSPHRGEFGPTSVMLCQLPFARCLLGLNRWPASVDRGSGHCNC